LNIGSTAGFGAAFIVTPLFQTSFVPDLMQVNFFPATVAVVPALVHLALALTAANDGAAITDSASMRARKKRERVMR
jgi:hypothetical protein